MKRLVLILAMFPILFVARADMMNYVCVDTINKSLLVQHAYGKLSRDAVYYKDFPDFNGIVYFPEYLKTIYNDYKPTSSCNVWFYAENFDNN